MSSRFHWRTAGKSYSGRGGCRAPVLRQLCAGSTHKPATLLRATYQQPRSNLIRISITLLCAHWQLHSRPNQHTSPHYRVCPTIGNRTNLIRISIKLLCAHRRSHSRPISMPRLITASARPSVAARRFDLASPQRYCAPLISSSSNLIRILMTLLCVHRRSQSRLISTPRLITASARPPVAAQT